MSDDEPTYGDKPTSARAELTCLVNVCLRRAYDAHDIVQRRRRIAAATRAREGRRDGR